MWKEKIKEFLVNAGVKEEDIATFKEKMQEAKKACKESMKQAKQQEKEQNGPRGWMPHVHNVLEQMGIKEEDVQNIFTNMKNQWE